MNCMNNNIFVFLVVDMSSSSSSVGDMIENYIEEDETRVVSSMETSHANSGDRVARQSGGLVRATDRPSIVGSSFGVGNDDPFNPKPFPNTFSALAYGYWIPTLVPMYQ